MGHEVGTLYVVGTPIGNLQDLTPRAKEVLGTVDLIASEDTRRTRGLLSSIGANTKLMAYHEHNEAAETPKLLERLAGGLSVALVCDAGTPLISDPGLGLVRAALSAGVPLSTVPGPSAAVAALCVAGLPTDRFVFEGFLPRREAARQARLADLEFEPRTMVFYESVHRLKATMAALKGAFGENREAAIARELTKLHEVVHRGGLGALCAELGEQITLKGEFVIVVAGLAQKRSINEVEAQRVFELLRHSVPASKAVELTAAITGLSRNAVYRLTRV